MFVQEGLSSFFLKLKYKKIKFERKKYEETTDMASGSDI